MNAASARGAGTTRATVAPQPLSYRLIEALRSGSRRVKLRVLAGGDLLLLVVSAWVSFSLRLGELFEPSPRVWAMMGLAAAVSVLVFKLSGLYRPLIRFIGASMVWRLAQGMGMAALVWVVLGFTTQFAGDENVPRTMPLIFGVVGFALLTGARFAAHWLLWRPCVTTEPARRVLIYGAGSAGRQLAASLRAGGEVEPVAFVDDDRSLAGREIDGLRVHPAEGLRLLAQQLEADEVIVTPAAVAALGRSDLVTELQRSALRVRVLPPLADIASGRHLVSLVREVDIDDLLGRDALAPDPAMLAACVTGRVVLVTGAGGSIGSEICRQAAALLPQRLLLLEASEAALYEVHRRLIESDACDVWPVLGSVADRPLVERLLRKHGVQTIYHAAAYKHVPLVELNPIEGAANNVFGTLTLAQAAYAAGVSTFVLISTDKAVRPTNVMGATKRWAELIVQDLAAQACAAGTGQRFCAVRFGNVLGSSGSVVPLFKEQIARGGPVTVTDPEVTRYFMSIHEAVALVIQAGSLARGGEIFLVDMGEPVRIVDLARRMIGLAGLTVRDEKNPDGDIEIRYTGLRPGEKLFEELLITSGKAQATGHAKVMCADEPSLAHDRFNDLLRQLHGVMKCEEGVHVRKLLLDVATDVISD